MPRLTRRLLRDYSCFHIISRGNQRQETFFEPADFIKYLAMLKRAKRKYNIQLYSYCLMPNHVHMLVEVECCRDMSLFMAWLNRGYTGYFNPKYDKVGHLWQGRFISKPIVKGDYLITCANYIEANPVISKLVNDIADYPWSSYKERCFYKTPYILDPISWNNETPKGTLLKSEPEPV